jgi:hypothetical protein
LEVAMLFGSVAETAGNLGDGHAFGERNRILDAEVGGLR